MKPISIQNFELLSDMEKENTIWECGTYLTNFIRGDKICDVYVVDNFYVGLCYELHKSRKAEIKQALYPEFLVKMVQS